MKGDMIHGRVMVEVFYTRNETPRRVYGEGLDLLAYFIQNA